MFSFSKQHFHCSQMDSLSCLADTKGGCTCDINAALTSVDLTNIHIWMQKCRDDLYCAAPTCTLSAVLCWVFDCFLLYLNNSAQLLISPCTLFSSYPISSRTALLKYEATILKHPCTSLHGLPVRGIAHVTFFWLYSQMDIKSWGPILSPECRAAAHLV